MAFVMQVCWWNTRHRVYMRIDLYAVVLENILDTCTSWVVFDIINAVFLQYQVSITVPILIAKLNHAWWPRSSIKKTVPYTSPGKTKSSSEWRLDSHVEGNFRVSSEIKTLFFWCHIRAFSAVGYGDCYSPCKGNPTGPIDQPAKWLWEAFSSWRRCFFGQGKWDSSWSILGVRWPSTLIPETQDTQMNAYGTYQHVMI